MHDPATSILRETARALPTFILQEDVEFWRGNPGIYQPIYRTAAIRYIAVCRAELMSRRGKE